MEKPIEECRGERCTGRAGAIGGGSLGSPIGARIRCTGAASVTKAMAAERSGAFGASTPWQRGRCRLGGGQSVNNPFREMVDQLQ